MIEITSCDAILLYMIVWLLIIVILWGREIVRVRRFDWELSNTKLFHCGKCHHTFLTKDEANLTRCPNCNAICIAKRKG